MEIACSADEPYLPHVSVMLRSLFVHTPARPMRVWLLHGKALSIEGCERVTQVATEHGVEIKFIFIEEKQIEGFSTKKFHPAAWYRILLPNLLPNLDRILYLDCDVIVTDDVTPLWNTDFDGKLFAAVCNPLFPLMRNWPKQDFGLDDPLDYLNSGVLLMNLAQMRREDVIERLRAYSTANPDRKLPEQDALSDLMRGRWVKLHPRWNAQTTFYDLPAWLLPYPREIVCETLEKPAIIHYNGPFKPWQYLCKHPLRGLYFEHLQQTPWPRRSLQGVTWFHRAIKPLPLALQYSAIELWMILRRRYVKLRRWYRATRAHSLA